MDRQSFIEFVQMADPDMAEMVRQGYCSWEDIGYDGGDDESALDDDDEDGEEGSDG